MHDFKAIAKPCALPMMIYRHRGNGRQGYACRSNGADFDGVTFWSPGRRPPTIHAGLHPVGDPYGAPTGRGKRSFRLPKSPNEGTRPSDGRSACPGLDDRGRGRAWLTGIPAFVDVLAGVERESEGNSKNSIAWRPTVAVGETVPMILPNWAAQPIPRSARRAPARRRAPPPRGGGTPPGPRRNAGRRSRCGSAGGRRSAAAP